MKKLNLLLISIFILSIAFGQINRSNIQIKTKTPDLQKTQKGINNEIPCTSGNLFSNPYENIHSATPSEQILSSTLATQFTTIGGDIETISVWGINAFYDFEFESWSACEDTDTDFSIVFYQDINNEVGDTVVSFESITATKTQTDVVFEGFTVYEYSFTLPESVDASNGFLSLLPNAENNSCWFLWMSSTSGYGNAKSFNDTVWTNLDLQFTMCLGGTPSDCTAPTNISVDNITESTADLSWTESGTAENWNIEYGLSGFNQGEGTLESVTEPSINITGLTPASTYQFYVQADCGSGSSSIWTGPYSFYTACETVNSFPHSDGFETTNEYFQCWNILYNTEEDGGLNGNNLIEPPTTNTWVLLTPEGFNGNGANYINNGDKAAAIGYPSPDFNWLVSRNIEVPASGSYELKWWQWYKSDADYVSKLHLVISINNSWNTLATYSTEAQTNEYASEMQVSLNDYLGETIKIAFVYEYNDGYQAAIDDITIDETTNNQLIGLDDLSIYPNPAKNTLFVSNGEGANITIYNMLGDVVKNDLITSSNQQLDISSLSSGTYIVKIRNNNNTVTSKINITN